MSMFSLQIKVSPLSFCCQYGTAGICGVRGGSSVLTQQATESLSRRRQ